MKNFNKKALSGALSMALLLGVGATFAPMTAHASTIPNDIQIKTTASRSSVIVKEVIQEEPGRYTLDGIGFDNIGSITIYDVNGKYVPHRFGLRTDGSYTFYNAYGKSDGVGKIYMYDKEGQLITVVNIYLYAFEE